MSQSIYVLEGTKQARKRFIKEGKPQMEFSYAWIPTEVTFDTLQDLEELIKGHLIDGKPIKKLFAFPEQI